MEWPEAKAGMPVSAAMWNKARAAVRALKVIAGHGVRVRPTPNGTVVSADIAPPPWVHPFKVSVSGNQATIVPGFVNTEEARIDGVPLSGTEKLPPPVLKWAQTKWDKEGRGYIALELTCDEDWILVKDKVEVVQVAYYDSEDGTAPPKGAGGNALAGGVPGLPGKRARFPLAMLRRRSSGRIDVFQIVQGDLNHRADPRDKASEIARHFFS